MSQVESFFKEIVDHTGRGMMMALSSFKPALVFKILVWDLPSRFAKIFIQRRVGI